MSDPNSIETLREMLRAAKDEVALIEKLIATREKRAGVSLPEFRYVGIRLAHEIHHYCKKHGPQTLEQLYAEFKSGGYNKFSSSPLVDIKRAVDRSEEFGTLRWTEDGKVAAGSKTPGKSDRD